MLSFIANVIGLKTSEPDKENVSNKKGILGSGDFVSIVIVNFILILPQINNVTCNSFVPFHDMCIYLIEFQR